MTPIITQLEWIETPSSSWVKKYAYKDNTLYLCFKNNKMFKYNIPPSVYQEFVSAKSKGEYFHRYIKMKYLAEKFDEKIDT